MRNEAGSGPNLLGGAGLDGQFADRLRRDARHNRAAILDAARELFADSADVAMSQVARRAGVGQATLYRNFPNRAALVAEILDEHVERIASIAADHEGDPDAFFILLRRLIGSMVELVVVARLAQGDVRADSHLERGRLRVAELLESPLRDAKAAGTLRRDITVGDVFLLLAMARGAMEGLGARADRTAAGHRMLALALDGLIPTGSRA
jgi:AcrR family transcriptional regulator